MSQLSVFSDVLEAAEHLDAEAQSELVAVLLRINYTTEKTH